MSDLFEVQVDIEGVQRMLLEAPANIARKGLYRALKAGSQVVESYLLARTPRGDDKDPVYPPLRQSIVTAIDIDETARTGESATGFGQSGFKAVWVEYGHHMIGHRPLKKNEGTVKPRPFMRPAAAAAADDAAEAFRSSLASTISEEYE